MSLFKSLGKLVGDVADIALAPVEIAVDMTRVVTKPVADMAKEMTEEIKKDVEELNEE